MKNLKMKSVLMLLVGALSILPGCGKKNNNNDGAVIGGGGVVDPNYIINNGAGGSGGCATVTYNTALTITFYGNLTPYSSGIKAQLPAYALSSYTGGFSSNYTRTNVAGDTLNVYVSGNQAYAVANLAAPTVNAIVMSQGGGGYYGGGYGGGYGTAQICGLYIDASIYASPQTGAGWSGTIGGGTIMMWSNGRWISNVTL